MNIYLVQMTATRRTRRKAYHIEEVLGVFANTEDAADYVRHVRVNLKLPCMMRERTLHYGQQLPGLTGVLE